MTNLMKRVVLVLTFFLLILSACNPYADLDLSDDSIYKWERLTYVNHAQTNDTDNWALVKIDTVELTNKEVKELDRLYRRKSHGFRIEFRRVD